MKKLSKLGATLFVLIFFVLAAPAYADPFTISANATLFWDTLRFTADPGVTITWLSQPQPPDTLAFAAFFPKPREPGQLIHSSSTNSWDPVAYSDQVGSGLLMSEIASADSLSSNIVWSDILPDHYEGVNRIERRSNFQVTGSGNITFSIDYNLTVNRSIPLLSSPSVSGGGNADVFLDIYAISVPGGPVYFDHAILDIPHVNDSLSKDGTLIVQRPASDGVIYTFSSRAAGDLIVHVPEPSSLIVLAIGFVGVIAVKFKRFA
jgi:hypothetical protein